jgi:hypothetical protein
VEDEDVEDMETSHDGEKDAYMVAKKREAPKTEGGDRVAQQLNLLENSLVPSTGASPVKEQEKKRARKNGGGDDDINSSMNRSALSFEESGQAQSKSWLGTGLASARVVRALLAIQKQEKPDVFFLFETHLSNAKA